MSWENVLKEPEMEPPMEEPPMEEPPMMPPPMGEPMVDPMTGLPIDPNAAPIEETPAHPNPTGEKEFSVDPEVEDDNDLNKWFSTIKKAPVAGQSMTQEQYNAQFQQPNLAAVDPNKKKQEAEAAALREKLADAAKAKTATTNINADFQRRAQQAAKAKQQADAQARKVRQQSAKVKVQAKQQAAKVENRRLNPTVLSRAKGAIKNPITPQQAANVNPDAPIDALMAAPKAVANTAKRGYKGAEKLLGANMEVPQTDGSYGTGYNNEKRLFGNQRQYAKDWFKDLKQTAGFEAAQGETQSPNRKIFEGAKNTAINAGNTIVDGATSTQVGDYGKKKAGDKRFTPSKLLPSALTGVKNMGKKELGKWKEANQRVKDRYQEKDDKEQAKLDKRKDLIARRTKIMRDKQRGQRLDESSGEYAGRSNRPVEYTNPETGEKQVGTDNIEDLKRVPLEIGRDKGTGRYESQKATTDFVEASDYARRLKVDWPKWERSSAYRSKLSTQLQDRFNVDGNLFEKYKDRLNPSVREEYTDKFGNKRTRMRPKVTASKVTPRSATGEENVRRYSVSKQDRRDDPALWESWDGGLVD